MSKNNKNRHSLPAVILAIVVVAAGAFGIIDSNSADDSYHPYSQAAATLCRLRAALHQI